MKVLDYRTEITGLTAPDKVSPSKFFTAKVSKQIAELRGWNWSRIMIILHYWIAVVIVFQIVAGSFTVVFLSYLRIKLATVPIGLVYLAFAVVGLAMFLIPIIPGVPVYLTGGIILTDASLAESLGGGTSGVRLGVRVGRDHLFRDKTSRRRHATEVHRRTAREQGLGSKHGQREQRDDAVHSISLDETGFERAQSRHSRRWSRLADKRHDGYSSPGRARDAHRHLAGVLSHHADDVGGRVHAQGVARRLRERWNFQRSLSRDVGGVDRRR